VKHVPITVGIDVGTTSITALAVTEAGEVAASVTVASEANVTAPADRARGRSEWDATRLVEQAQKAVAQCAQQLGARAAEVCGIGLTGQQHGGVVVDRDLQPVTPLINWQDRRAEEPAPDGRSFLTHARESLGVHVARRAGCTLSAGFLGATLYWLQRNAALPEIAAWACFVADLVGARLTGNPPQTDPTNGASSGLFDLKRRTWDEEAVARLEIPRTLLPPVAEAGDPLGRLCEEAAQATGLAAGTPVFVGLGDNQASVLGSVADLRDTVLVNVGTGAQVARCCEAVHYAPPLETRPFAREGYLLVHAGLSGGRAYAALERFFAGAVRDFCGTEPAGRLYERMNALAAQVPAGADGLRFDPTFAGTRSDPFRRASLGAMSEANFTPAHMVRALLEGMARGFREGYDNLRAALGSDAGMLVGAGNGLRENPLLAQMVADEFGLPLHVPRHHEEAAFGAALVAGFGAGVFPSLEAAGKAVHYAD
jgi:sugar (pentulose or hexulose) kinase